MIVIEKATLGSLSAYIGRRLALVFAFDVVVATAYVFLGWKWLALPDVPLSIFGGVIGLMAGFRNSSAYARWWEARILWGGIVNSSRNFAREVLSMVVVPEAGEAEERDLRDTRRRLVLLQVAYVHALRHHLRGTPPWLDLTGLIPDHEMKGLKSQSNVPLAIQQTMASILTHCYRLGWIDTMRWVSLDRTLNALMDFQGASERIKNTPMPRLYDMFIKRFIEIYCLLLPLGMVESLRLLTPAGSTCVAFVFLALDQIGRDLEAPFENLPNDISLTAISRNIEINLKQMLCEKEIPECTIPVDGILW